MINIIPFRGVRYNKEEIGDINLVVTAPYDNIDNKLQEEYYNRSEYNFVRLNRSRLEEKYQSANQFFQQWMKDNILLRDEKPAIYYYTQEYEVEGTTRIRKGFISLLEVDEFENGNVLPHEHTLSGPKRDRLDLLIATEANFGQIFMLYSEPEDRVIKLLSQFESEEADIKVNDEYNNKHTLWKIDDEKIIQQAQEIMKAKKAYIADGHHRYETSINYRNMQKEKLENVNGDELFHYIMCTFVNMDDQKGLSVLPTHRAIKNLDSFDLDQLLSQLEKNFVISTQSTLDKLSHALENNKTESAFGLIANQGNSFYLLKLKSQEGLDAYFPANYSQALKELDVQILHQVILEGLLGIDEEKLRQHTHVNYFRHKEELLQLIQAGEFQLGFLLNGTKVSEVKAVTEGGEKMPQKSTDFYPKLLSGLVINYLK